ncbi:MAG: hypothetical protein M0Z50_04925, partial [Planctomycetia bacterium]|nr:hypothetical protein [Planctomycetia bacterium]
AVSNNAASLNSCIRPSAITSPDGLRLHCFHQVRERLQIAMVRELLPQPAVNDLRADESQNQHYEVPTPLAGLNRRHNRPEL